MMKTPRSPHRNSTERQGSLPGGPVASRDPRCQGVVYHVVAHPALSPDGRVLATEREEPPTYDLWRSTRPAGGGVRSVPVSQV